MRLSRWQRIKRRVSLWGGSYTYPDGTIELDFHEKAGIDPFLDSEEEQDAKLQRYFREAPTRRRQNWGAAFVAVAAWWIASSMGMSLWSAFAIAALIGFGLHLLVTGHWPSSD